MKAEQHPRPDGQAVGLEAQKKSPLCAVVPSLRRKQTSPQIEGMTPATSLPATVQRRVLALEWEANCEHLRCALGLLPRPFEEPPAELMASIRRARELLAELERLHNTAACTPRRGDVHSTGERVSGVGLALSPGDSGHG